MKNLFLLFLLFGFTLVNAQKYVFNTLTKYSTHLSNSDNKHKGEAISYTNSNNDTYFLRIKKHQFSFIADLYDYKTLKVHKFKVTESKINGEIFFKFDYEKTSDLYYFSKNDYSKYVFTFQTLELNDSIRKVRFNVYKNSKKKKPLMVYNLEIKKYPSNLFAIFRISCIHPYEFLEKLNIFENGVVISGNGNTLFRKQIEHKLEELKQVNFELDIPKPKE